MHAIIFATLLVAAADGDGPRVDCFGDPLPDGALARMGTVRLRCDEPAEAAALSADHATLVTLDTMGEIHVWNTANGAHVREIHVWNSADGAHVQEIHALRALEIALSPDGKSLACATEDHALRLMEVATGNEIRRLEEKHKMDIRVLAFSPDWKTLAAGGDDGVHLWDAATGMEVARRTGYDGEVWFLSFSGDGARLAAGFSNRAGITTQVTETATGKVVGTPLGGRAQLSPDGKRAVIASYGPAVSLWEVDRPKKIRTYGEQSGSPFPVAFTPDGKAFWTTAAIADGCRSYLWDAASGEKRAEVFGRALCLSTDGKVLALGDSGDAVRLCDGATGKDLHPEFGHCAAVSAAAFAPDGKTLLTGAEDDFLGVWDVNSGKLVRRLPADPPPDFFSFWRDTLNFSPDGRTITACRDKLRRWDAATWKEWDAPTENLENLENVACLSPDGRLLFRGGLIDNPLLWDVVEHKEVRSLPGVGGAEVWFAPTFSADGALAAAAIDPGARHAKPFQVESMMTAAVWEVQSGRLVRSITCSVEEASYDGLLLRINSRTLIVATGNKIRSWDLGTGGEYTPLNPLKSPLRSIALSPDGRWGAAGDDDGVVRLWETATRREVRQWKGHRRPVSALVFSPDGKTLASTSWDATALLWDVAGRLERREPIRTAEQQAALWVDLASDDAVRARRAVQILAADPERSVPLLKEKLSPVVVDGPRVARLIADLNNDDFEEREKAQNELAKQGRTVLPALRQALAAHPPPESKRRIEELLERRHTFTGEELRDLRAVCALEWAGTTDARTLLEALSKGAAAAVQTDEAAAALRRLERKTQPPPTSETTATAADK